MFIETLGLLIKLGITSLVAYVIYRYCEERILRIIGVGVCVIFALIVLAGYLGINLR